MYSIYNIIISLYIYICKDIFTSEKVLNLSLNSYIICSRHCTFKPVNLHYSASSCSTTNTTNRFGVLLHCVTVYKVLPSHHFSPPHQCEFFHVLVIVETIIRGRSRPGLIFTSFFTMGQSCVIN